MAALFSSGRILVVLLGMAVMCGLLWLPVLGDRLQDLVSRNAPRFAPRMFALGLGLLVVGLIAGVKALDIAGGCLIGALVLAAILDNY